MSDFRKEFLAEAIHSKKISTKKNNRNFENQSFLIAITLSNRRLITRFKHVSEMQDGLMGTFFNHLPCNQHQIFRFESTQEVFFYSEEVAVTRRPVRIQLGRIRHFDFVDGGTWQ